MTKKQERRNIYNVREIRHLFTEYKRKINYCNNYHFKMEKDEVWKEKIYCSGYTTDPFKAL